MMCCSCSRPSNGISVEAHGYGPKSPIRKVSVESEGSAQVAERFRRVLAVAFMDYGLELEPDRKKAEGVVKVHAQEKAGPKPIYGEILTVKLLTRDGKTREIDACQYTTEQPILTPNTWSLDHRLYLANRLREKAPELKSFFIGPLNQDKNAVLGQAIRADLLNESYTLTSDRGQADAILEEARPHAVEYSLNGLQQDISIKATVDAWKGYSFISNATRSVYTPIVEPNQDSPEACSLTVYTYNNSADPMWDTATQLAASLAGHK
jgi:hypothetical protein